MEYDIDKWDYDDDEIFKPLNKKNEKDVKGTRDYCDEHEFYYGNQSCEPIWDEKTGDLKIYEIMVHQNKTDKLKFVKKRNKKNKHKPKQYKKKR